MLFVVRHEHEPDRCPARDPAAGASLLNHLSRPNAARSGVEIVGEAVARAEHSLYMIVEALDEAAVRRFMRPFAEAGTLDVLAASTCARVVASGGCDASPPGVVDDGPALDPEEACQRAIEQGLVVHRAHPLNAETSVPALLGGVVVPNAHFYVRNHFQIPALDANTWRLAVGGLVERPLELSLRDLQNMPSRTEVVTLECAGNGRSLFDPPVKGEPWQLGAVSTAEWTGVPLFEVLDRAGVVPEAREVVFRGADEGTVEGSDGRIGYERSLRVDDARDPTVLLAYAMNGEALPVQHGYPLRVVVPGWYAMASVKWLIDLELTERGFEGRYQTGSYVYEWERDGEPVTEPVTLQQVRSLVTEPAPGAVVGRGDVAIRGVAWSGAAPVARVEVAIGGRPWQEAALVGERRRGSWQWWELLTRLDEPGPTTVRARATDLAGRVQPERAEWNRLGYGNNAIQSVAVTVS